MWLFNRKHCPSSKERRHAHENRTKTEQVTSSGPEWGTEYLTREKTKGVYFPCHKHQKSLTFLAMGKKMQILAIVHPLNPVCPFIFYNMWKYFDMFRPWWAWVTETVEIETEDEWGLLHWNLHGRQWYDDVICFRRTQGGGSDKTRLAMIY